MVEPERPVTDDEIATWLAGDIGPGHEDALLKRFDKDPSVAKRIKLMSDVEDLYRSRKRPESVLERQQPDPARAARLDQALDRLTTQAAERAASASAEAGSPAADPEHHADGAGDPVPDGETKESRHWARKPRPAGDSD